MGFPVQTNRPIRPSRSVVPSAMLSQSAMLSRYACLKELPSSRVSPVVFSRICGIRICRQDGFDIVGLFGLEERVHQIPTCS